MIGAIAFVAGSVFLAALGLSLTDAVVVCAALGYCVKVIADQRGWTRSTALVRQENADLRERNATLAGEVERLDTADREKDKQIAVLQSEIRELKERDQGAVLDQLRQHEVQAGNRHEQFIARNDRLHEVLIEIRDTLKEGASP